MFRFFNKTTIGSTDLARSNSDLTSMRQNMDNVYADARTAFIRDFHHDTSSKVLQLSAYPNFNAYTDFNSRLSP
jgi:hypothetical protein